MKTESKKFITLMLGAIAAFVMIVVMKTDAFAATYGVDAMVTLKAGTTLYNTTVLTDGVAGVVPKDYVAFVVEDGEVYTKVTCCDITGYVYQEFIGHDEGIIAIYEEEQEAARLAAEEAARLAAEAEAEYQRQLEILAHSQEIAELAAIIYLESGNQEYVGQVAVGAVVMNRVKSPYFPNTIHDVIFAPGQFSPAYKLYDAIASGKVKQSCMQAALEAWFGVDPTGGCHYFRRVNGTPGLVIGAHVFH